MNNIDLGVDEADLGLLVEKIAHGQGLTAHESERLQQGLDRCVQWVASLARCVKPSQGVLTQTVRRMIAQEDPNDPQHRTYLEVITTNLKRQAAHGDVEALRVLVRAMKDIAAAVDSH